MRAISSGATTADADALIGNSTPIETAATRADTTEIVTPLHPGRSSSWRKLDDAALFEFAQQLNFSGPPWEVLERNLVAYALGCLQGWADSGQIFAIAYQNRTFRHPVTPAQRDWFRSDAHTRADLINTAVAKALRQFTRAARDGRGWRPDGGASLTTYFLRRCLYTFGGEFFALWREHLKWCTKVEVNSDKLDWYAANSTFDQIPDDAYDGISETLDQLAPRDRAIVLAKAQGCTYREIAAQLGVTEKAIERRVARLREMHPWIRAI